MQKILGFRAKLQTSKGYLHMLCMPVINERALSLLLSFRRSEKSQKSATYYLNGPLLQIRQGIEIKYPINSKTESLEGKSEVGLVAEHGSRHVVVGVLHALLVPDEEDEVSKKYYLKKII